eukprot:m.495859 g.495859  ORF g.495859 m.495859 type:complete len:373 (-) comp21803_c0_seq1:2940-4058(-)
MASEDGVIRIADFLRDCAAGPREMRAIAQSASGSFGREGENDTDITNLLDPAELVSVPSSEVTQENIASLAEKTSLATLQDVLLDVAPKRGRFTHRGRCRADNETETATRTATSSGRSKGPGTAPASVDQEICDDVVITISCHHPRKGTFTQVFDVRGDDTLQSVRDQLECIDEHNYWNAMPSWQYERPTYPPAFFFIENIFYVDKRSARDYSEEYARWLAEVRARVGGLETGTPSIMNAASSENVPSAATRCTMDTKLKDLSVRLHRPYVLLHHGDCEHCIVFQDIRIMTDDDVVSQVGTGGQSLAPHVLFQASKVRVNCMICDIFPADRVVRDTIAMPFNPCFFCKHCESAVVPLLHGQDVPIYRYSHNS